MTDAEVQKELCMVCGKELPRLSEPRRFPEACYDCIWASEKVKVPRQSAEGPKADVVDFSVKMPEELEQLNRQIAGLKSRVSVLEDCVGISIKGPDDAVGQFQQMPNGSLVGDGYVPTKQSGILPETMSDTCPAS